MESKSNTASTASLLARLKPKPVKPERRVPIEDIKSSESRRSRRQSACLQGIITADRLSEPMTCVIRNLSATGARIELVRGDKKPFESEQRIPDLFTLAIRLERTEVDCEIVWQRGNTLGVRFISLQRRTG